MNGALLLPARPGPDTRTPTPTAWRWVAAAGTVTAAVLHGAAAAEQLAGSPALACAFLLTALAQLGAGAWLALGDRGSGWDTRAVGVVLAATTALVLVFVVAHTTGWLAGLHGAAEDHAAHLGHAIKSDGAVALGAEAPAEIHPADALGTATVAAELVTVLALTALLPARSRRVAVNLLLGAGLVLWSAWLTGSLG